MSDLLSAACRRHWFFLELFLALQLPLEFAAAPPLLAQAFQRRTHDAGLDIVRRTNGVALADYDRDGDLDIYFVVRDSYDGNDPRTWNRLFSNRGDGTFFEVTTVAGLAGRNSNPTENPNGMGNKMGAAWGDYDNDGWPDLFLTHYGADQLFHNNGNGTFTEVTAAAGLSTRRGQLSSSALWFDYDLDGDLDLYISIYAEFFTSSNDRSNKLYENLGQGKFQDVSLASGVDDPGPTWTTVALDANADGKLDLYLANDFGPSKLYLNNGDKTFQEKTAAFGVENNFHGMGLAIADCDANGYFDLYLTNITEYGNEQEINPLFLNTGRNAFVNKAVESGVALAGWGWGTEFFDLENDGDEDLFVVTGNFSREFTNVLFRNTAETGTPHFENISQQAGVADSAVARGIVAFDYDNDGDTDLLISNFFEPPALYENSMGHGNWLEVNLEGTVSNRDGLGAIVEAWVGGKAYRKYHHGAQFLAQSLLPVHFGLGNAAQIERLRVFWPSGHIDEVEALPANQRIRIKEGNGIVSAVSERATNPPAVPVALRLLGNYPNPFNGATRIQFALAVPGVVELRILNAQGQSITVMQQSFSTAGEKVMRWEASDSQAGPVSSGIYFYRLSMRDAFAKPELGKLLYLK